MTDRKRQQEQPYCFIIAWHLGLQKMGQGVSLISSRRDRSFRSQKWDNSIFYGTQEAPIKEECCVYRLWWTIQLTLPWSAVILETAGSFCLLTWSWRTGQAPLVRNKSISHATLWWVCSAGRSWSKLETLDGFSYFYILSSFFFFW